MIFINWILLITIGGLIGWLTNRLAIRLLFWPYDPIRIPVLGFLLQGLIPRRKSALAHSVGTQIEKELLSMEDILQQFGSEKQKTELTLFLRLYFNEIILEKIPTVFHSFMKKPVDHLVHDLLERESDRLLNEILEYLMEDGIVDFNIGTMVEERIVSFPMERLEEMILAVAKRELQHIEWIGGVLGMMIGFIQGALFIIIESMS